MKRVIRASLTIAIATAMIGLAVTQARADRVSFLRWAKESVTPLSIVSRGPHWEGFAPLGKMIGNATVVALSEAVHGAAEPLEFRNRMIEYLVEEKGFTAIAIESGIVESRIVHEYVLGGPGDLSAVLAEGISWTMDQLLQNHALVRWLRRYNADVRLARKVNFYGFDVPGSPGNPTPNRGMDSR